ncbi:iron-sulfur cluster biosynthesis family protein [Actinophytocola algeriensis]|jgi:Fe-S cluster assembly iron-binding protein IscA|uniref:Fe-S cluster assembly iron-binding protein IscA n=1 Tax=Actinophytocola algeriensis TaxID=1768010 RepID=A0A7W7Q6A0_9PSEU|nr:iron-sulfur cluster biosynthesis family protein [Actinophytocola algeriensis]MBB4907851.1 Fe-S cluster assembly iron-binding protein IscA [Actinophytocola algeriensis]MBE1479881.1 Fe-S cluster assembly iron-binding protein IscA [Actinophytocola algeriensis]
MLAVTEAAAEAISALTAQGGKQEGGLRFAMQASSDSQAALALTVAPAPADGDQVVTANEGAHVFLEPEAADYLTDKVLDVQPDADGQLSFAVLEQA